MAKRFDTLRSWSIYILRYIAKVSGKYLIIHGHVTSSLASSLGHMVTWSHIKNYHSWQKTQKCWFWQYFRNMGFYYANVCHWYAAIVILTPQPNILINLSLLSDLCLFYLQTSSLSVWPCIFLSCRSVPTECWRCWESHTWEISPLVQIYCMSYHSCKFLI